MGSWIVVAAVGGILSLIGMGLLVLQYRRGELSGPHLALLVGLFAIIVVIAVWALEYAAFALLVFWIPASLAVQRSRRRGAGKLGGS